MKRHRAQDVQENKKMNEGCGTFLDILTSQIIYVIREICHADLE